MARGENKEYSMVGGEGENSYIRNSLSQGASIDAAEKPIKDVISKNLAFQSIFSDSQSRVIRIADFGCSVGPNTFKSVKNIIDGVELKLSSEGIANSIEFQVFFNDHAANDFNTLFKTLPSNREYFTAAAPGTFHSQVLPTRSIHIGNISTALHWLSRVPKEAVEYNKKRIHCSGNVKEVADAYAAQFRNDAAAFLSARAREIVPGGLMLITARSLEDGAAFSETSMSMFIELLESSLRDMAEEGLIEEERLESFNVPVYFACLNEFKKVCEAEEFFKLEGSVTLKNPMEHIEWTGRTLALMARALFEGIIKEHFGDDIVDKVFENLGGKTKNRVSDFQRCQDMDFLLVLSRKRE